MEGWAKPKVAARYAGVSTRTFSGWLKKGLKHSRLPGGRVLVKYDDLDAWLRSQAVDENQVDLLVDSIMREVSGKYTKAGRAS
jgi:excisionase family DNA binding protein